MSLLSFKKLLKLCCGDLHDFCNRKNMIKMKYKITLYYNIVYSSSMYPINLSIKINFNIPTHMFNFLSIPFLFRNILIYLYYLSLEYFKLSEIFEYMRFLKIILGKLFLLKNHLASSTQVP